jgi:hypothetical protein
LRPFSRCRSSRNHNPQGLLSRQSLHSKLRNKTVPKRQPINYSPCVLWLSTVTPPALYRKLQYHYKRDDDDELDLNKKYSLRSNDRHQGKGKPSWHHQFFILFSCQKFQMCRLEHSDRNKPESCSLFFSFSWSFTKEDRYTKHESYLRQWNSFLLAHLREKQRNPSRSTAKRWRWRRRTRTRRGVKQRSQYLLLTVVVLRNTILRLQALRPIERSGRLRKHGRWGSLRRRNTAAIHRQGKSTAGGRHRSQHERASERTLPANDSQSKLSTSTVSSGRKAFDGCLMWTGTVGNCLPYYLGSFHTNYIIFRNVKFFKYQNFKLNLFL